MSEPAQETGGGAREVRITLDVEDHVAFHRLFLARALRQPRTWFHLGLSALVVSAGATIGVKVFTGDDLPMPVALALFILTPLVRVGWGYWLTVRHARRIFAQQQSLHLPFDLTWDEESLTTRSEQGTVRLEWLYVLRVVEDRRLILVYESEALARLVPRRFFTPDQQADFLACARAVVPADG
ncbi:hypothetical protein GCM10007301_34600 [Azorhizobium oxalatiphilum]|uniref:YcxB-like C-terminal domain-containing protein n=1 Tax=Azorhizobium oxalatiphilum TaxID=980631 RepID=A0A917C4H1_9HYPH|nr:YcxB family protein [Azorhizobium oxalatiphilum]GGF71936.1 hypothetical protein GCM10007301_34600 [Azorhizobium oxalatiphilum]